MDSDFRDYVEKVRAASPIEDVVASDVQLHQSGSRLIGLSPFNQEKTPSFHVRVNEQRWHDFSGGGSTGGDVFDYLQRKRGLSFMEALNELAQRAGIRRPNQDPEAYAEEQRAIQERRGVESVLAIAAEYYHRVLPEEIRESWYREHYGFTDETIERFVLGWADGGLHQHLQTLGVSEDAMLKSGLVIRKNGRLRDFVYHHLFFPYLSRGRVCYAIARATSDDAEPKYLKLPTYPTNQDVSPSLRNDVIFGEAQIRGAADVVLITEGITDAISASQAGFACISPATTTFRPDDRETVLRLTRGAKRIVICNDNEVSGSGFSGALQTARWLHANGRDVRIAQLPRSDEVDKVDVNSFLVEHSTEEFQAVVDVAKRYVEILIEEIPAETVLQDLDARLAPVLREVITAPPAAQAGYCEVITRRFSVTKQVVAEMLKLARTRAEQPNKGEGQSAGPTAEKEKSQAKRLVELALEQNLELLHDQQEDCFAAITDEQGRRRILSLRSREFSLWMSRLAFKESGIAPGGEIMSTASLTLASIARFDGLKYELHVRNAWHEGAIWIALDEYRAVEVRPGHWRVVDVPPILFRRFRHQRTLPTPQPGGDIKRVLDFLRIDDPHTRLLFLAYLVTAMVPGIPIATLVLHGDQGSAKTTSLKVIKRLLDPSSAETRGGCKDLAEFAQIAAQNRVLFFDNLTHIPTWLADALCRLVTGDGFTKRSLYSDDDNTVFEFQGVAGLSGINLVAENSDLLDRALLLQLARVPDTERRLEEEFWAEFGRARPQILGAMLDLLAKAMEVKPALRFDRLPRMADFVRWGTAVTVGMGHTKEEYLRAYDENVRRQNTAAVDSSPVAQAVALMMRTRSRWEGTPAELLVELGAVAETNGIRTTAREWPKAANWLTKRMRLVRPNLAAFGIEFQEERTDARRTVALTRTEPPTGPDGAPDAMADATRDGVMDGVIGNSLSPNGHDANDANDGIFSTTEVEDARGLSIAQIEAFDERAAIYEFDGEFSKKTAEELARTDLTSQATTVEEP